MADGFRNVLMSERKGIIDYQNSYDRRKGYRDGRQVCFQLRHRDCLGQGAMVRRP